MTLALATRGYLCRHVVTGPPRDPPSITDVRVDTPSIQTTNFQELSAPSIVAANPGAPMLRGAVQDPQPADPGSPSVVGGASLVPIIRKATKE